MDDSSAPCSSTQSSQQQQMPADTHSSTTSTGKSGGRFSVGYALAPKKVESFIQPSLTDHANKRGIDLIPIDLSKPLIGQGPFHCVVHKIYTDDWNKQLQQLKQISPNIPIIDSPDAIQPLQNRISMLEVVNHLQLDDAKTFSLGIPKQLVVDRDHAESLSNPNFLDQLNFEFPVIAKPLIADGTSKSHEMSLVFNSHGLSKIKPPVVLQEFVNHGGVIFKVYVAGDYVQCVKRKSLPDLDVSVSGRGLKSGGFGDVCPFAHISNLQDGDDGSHLSSVRIEEAELPSLSFVGSVARGLQRVIKLHLFNFDMIRDARMPDRYLIIDINYFPGYAKMPGYETILTDFFLDVVTGKEGNGEE